MYGGGGSMGSMGSYGGSSGQGMPTSLIGGQSNEGIYFDSSSGLYTDGQGNYYSDPRGEQQVRPANKQAAKGVNYGQQQTSVDTQPTQNQAVTSQQAGQVKPDLKADNAKEGAKTGNPYMAMGGAATDTAEYIVGKADYNNSPQKEIDENAEKLSDEEVKQEKIRTGNMRQAYEAPGDADKFININSKIQGRGPLRGAARVMAGGLQQMSRGEKLKADDIYNLYTGGYNNLDQLAANDAENYNRDQRWLRGGPMRRWLYHRGVIG